MLASINTPRLFLVVEEGLFFGSSQMPVGRMVWDGGEERRGEEQQFEGGGGGMCDEMRCEVFPHSVGTCVKDSSREGENS